MKELVQRSVVRLHPIHTAILSELDETYKAGRVKLLARRLLLQILHMTRALDSFLRAFLDHHGCRGDAIALESYLYALKDHTVPGLGNMTEIERQHFQGKIVDRRNTYMHEAGTTPMNDQEILDLLSEMNNCLARVLSL